MPFPASSATVPSLTSFQGYFNGLTFGGSSTTSSYKLKKFEGFRGLPPTRTGDQGRPRDHGEFEGLDLMGGREITATIDVQGGTGLTYSTIAAASAAIGTALTPQGTTLLPLWYSDDGVSTYAAMVRARDEAITEDITYSLGSLAQNVPIHWHANDPRWYLAPTNSTTLNLANATGGLTFNMSFPFGFTPTSGINSAVCTNSGNVDTRPIITFSGPLNTPSLQNLTAAGAPMISFNLVMAANDQLVVDTDYHTATYYYAGSSIGFPVNYAFGGFVFAANSANTVVFRSNDSSASGTCNVSWASAYIL